MNRRAGSCGIRFPLHGTAAAAVFAMGALLVGSGPVESQTAPTPAATPDFDAGKSIEVTRDVAYGRIDGMAMVYDVSRPAEPNGAGVIFVISGGFLSSPENQAYIQPVVEPLLDAGFTIFHLRHPSTPRYLAPEIYDALKLGRDHILEHAGATPRSASSCPMMSTVT